MPLESSDKVKIVALVVLGFCVVAAIIGVTIASVLTDRDLHYPEQLIARGVLAIAILGGLIVSFSALKSYRNGKNGKNGREKVNGNGE